MKAHGLGGHAVDLALDLGEQREDVDGALLDARRQGRALEPRADLAERRVAVRSSGRASPRSCGPVRRPFDQEAQSGQHMVAVLDDAAGDVLRQPASADRLQHSLPQIREGVQHGGDEHVAGHAADGVEVEVH